jgi:hypothetical protein
MALQESRTDHSPEPLLTPGQVARHLHIEEKTLAMWRSTRPQPLAFVKLGGVVRYRQQDVEEFIEGRLQCA